MPSKKYIVRDYSYKPKCATVECIKYVYKNYAYCYACNYIQEGMELSPEEQQELTEALNKISCNNDNYIDYLMRQAPGVSEKPEIRLEKAINYNSPLIDEEE